MKKDRINLSYTLDAFIAESRFIARQYVAATGARSYGQVRANARREIVLAWVETAESLKKREKRVQQIGRLLVSPFAVLAVAGVAVGSAMVAQGQAGLPAKPMDIVSWMLGIFSLPIVYEKTAQGFLSLVKGKEHAYVSLAGQKGMSFDAKCVGDRKFYEAAQRRLVANLQKRPASHKLVA